LKPSHGIAAAIGAAVLFGLSTPLAKALLVSTEPLMLAGLLYLGSGVGLSGLLAARYLARGEAINWPRGPEILWLLAAVAAGGMAGPFLLMYGLQSTDSASASLILNLEGVFTALLAWFVFKENFDRRIALGMALIVAGGVVLSVQPTAIAAGWLGPLAIAGACLAWGIDNNLTRKVAMRDALFIACVKGLGAGATNVALALAYGGTAPAASIALQAGLLGFIGYGVSLALFVVALRGLGTARTGAYFSLAPFIGATFAVALGAPLTLALLAGGVLMGAGVWLHLTERHEHLHHHARLEHEHSHSHDEHHRHAHPAGPATAEPHSHPHVHEPLDHAHAHFPDIHHRHEHSA
jgi:drug/metabolite transporter (DMT)-like permease